MARPADAATPPRESLVLRHMPSLDSLRGVAVLLVLFFHGFGGFDWGALLGKTAGSLVLATIATGRYGVNVFFVLSGFLITGLLLQARPRGDYYRNFYVRRVLRILPVYILLLAVLKLWHVTDYRFTLAALLFLANFSRLFGAPMAEYGLLWSLAVEEHFYLLWPTCVRKVRVRALVGICVAVIVAEPMLRVLAIHITTNIDIHYKTPFVLDLIAYGALLALLVNTGRLHAGNVRRVALILLGVGGVLAAIGLAWGTLHFSWTLDALTDLPFSWFACGLVLLGLYHDHQRVQRGEGTKSSGVLPFFGYISYGLYLCNVLVFMKLRDPYFAAHPEIRHQLGRYTLATLLTAGIAVGVAYLSRRFFEAPFLRLKNRWQAPRMAPTVK